jgi:hypothetical protein
MVQNSGTEFLRASKQVQPTMFNFSSKVPTNENKDFSSKQNTNNERNDSGKYYPQENSYTN